MCRRFIVLKTFLAETFHSSGIRSHASLAFVIPSQLKRPNVVEPAKIQNHFVTFALNVILSWKQTKDIKWRQICSTSSVLILSKLTIFSSLYFLYTFKSTTTCTQYVICILQRFLFLPLLVRFSVLKYDGYFLLKML